eukprot:scaffold187441_cov27-Prasinocladus_malaysianus.AAC.1
MHDRRSRTGQAKPSRQGYEYSYEMSIVPDPITRTSHYCGSTTTSTTQLDRGLLRYGYVRGFIRGSTGTTTDLNFEYE